MSDKPSAAEQAFKEWWPTVAGAWAPGSNYVAKEGYLAGDANATERTARRCMEICRECDEKNWDAEDCGVIIAKEFGLE